MVTVRDVLNRLGTPPPEDVCLDWTNQLVAWASANAQNFDGRTVASLPQAARSAILEDWDSIEVDCNGILHVLTPASSQGKTQPVHVGKLMAQLHDWSQANPASTNANTPQVGRSSEPMGRRVQRSNNMRGMEHLRRTLWAATSLVGCSIILYACWRLITEQVASPSPEVAVLANASTEPNQAGNDGTGRAKTRITTGTPTDDLMSSLDEAPQLSTLSTKPQLPEPQLEGLSSLENLLTLREAETDLHQIEPLNPQPTRSMVPPTNDMEQQTSSVTSQVLDSTQPLPSHQSPAPMIDVLSELSQWSAATAEQATEKQVVTSTQTAPNAVGPPLLLSTSPAYQLTSLDVPIRARQLACRLRLSVSAEVVLTPTEAQMIEGSQWASWTLSDPTTSRQPPQAAQRPSPTAQTQVMVQVQLSQQRQAALRWRIVAGANDFPGVLIPVDSPLLDVVRAKLSHQLQWIAAERERLSALVRTPGLPSETRNMLYAQRRQLDTQRELATRWLQIVADAQLMHGWLDGQLEVHAAFMDTQPSPAVTLLQFGTP
jgi:hypothetical protein